MTDLQSALERLEIKYLIDEERARSVREFIKPYCSADPHNLPEASQLRPSYEICSIYLDSPALDFHRAWQRGDSERMKLRVRAYRGSDARHLEIKQRISGTVRKTRVEVLTDAVEACVLGRAQASERGFEVESGLHPEQAGSSAATQVSHFAQLAREFRAGPMLSVRYRREAYAGKSDEYARITFDRGIAVHPTASFDAWEPRDGWTEFDDHWTPKRAEAPVILEIKCQTCMPGWIRELIQQQGLIRRNFSKYSTGIYLAGVKQAASASGCS